MNNMVIKRRANVIHKLLVDIINNVIKNDCLGYISLTGVDLSNDLSFCNVFYTILNDKSEFLDLAQKLLEENKKEIRLKLARANQIKNIKKIPDLIFKYDEFLTYGKKIDKLLDNIKK